jgi:hypothetical protein
VRSEDVVIYLQLCAAGLLGMVLGGTIVAGILQLVRSGALGGPNLDAGSWSRGRTREIEPSK